MLCTVFQEEVNYHADCQVVKGFNSKTIIVVLAADFSMYRLRKLLNGARHRHEQRFQQSGRRINDQLLLYGKIGQALVKARQNGADAFAAIETVLPWEEFTASVGEANKLSQPEEFDFIHLMAENWPTYAAMRPPSWRHSSCGPAPAGQAVLEAVEQIRALNAALLKELPSGAPTAFIKKRWERLIRTDQGLDRRNYDCASSAN